MIRILKKIPRKVTVACSGGIDSMAFVNFLLEGKREVELAYFNHDTIHGKEAEFFVENYARNKNLKLHIGRVKGTRGKRSIEEFWRDERYSFFNNLKSDFLITCHHLDDVVETWIMSSLHGQSKLIPYKREPNIYRPFLMTEKSSIKKYAKSRNLKWVDDPGNSHQFYTRNYIRHKIMPHALHVNPGIRKTIRKKLIAMYL